MQTMRTARCVPADRFPDGVPGTGREPSSSPMTNASTVAANLRNDKYGLLRRLGFPPPARTRIRAPQGTTSYVTKRVFRQAPGRTLTPSPPPRLGRRRARVRTRRYLWTVQAARPRCTVAVFHHLRADASYR
eukprot:scaffold7621_cov70-Phaeocystis_antarctica.AAC.1